MSAMYTCDVYLPVDFSEAVVKDLIGRGRELGFNYFQQESYIPLDNPEVMSDEQACEHVMLGKAGRSDDFDFPKGLFIEYQELRFSITFHDEENGLNVHLLSLSADGKKVFCGREYFDVGRHIKILIDLCEKYPIVKITTEID